MTYILGPVQCGAYCFVMIPTGMTKYITGRTGAIVDITGQ